jgi:hypothetical protein
MAVHRSIVITFATDDPAVRSDIDFHRKLTDMRERYPTWSIRGITHERERLIPEKPRGLTGGETPPQPLPKERVSASRSPRDGDLEQDDLHSDDSTGNVVGEAPREVKPGLRVRVMVPPYNGKKGVVGVVRDENRFQVAIDGSGVWWCASDEVVVDREDSEEPAVSLSTLELMGELRRANHALEVEAARYRAAFMQLRLTVGEAVCDAALQST